MPSRWTTCGSSISSFMARRTASWWWSESSMSRTSRRPRRTCSDSWTSATPYQRIVTSYEAVPRINMKIETPDKENALFSAGLRLQMRDTDPDYPAMVLANYMFGGGGLTLASRTACATVKVSATVSRRASPRPPKGTRRHSRRRPSPIPATSRGRSELRRRARENAARGVHGGGARGGQEGDSRRADRQPLERPRILSLIASREQDGRTLAWDQRLDTKLDALTLEEINAAFRRHIDAAAISIVKGGDFKAAKVYQ